MAVRPLQLTLALLKPDIVAHPNVVMRVRQTIMENGLYFVRSKDMRLSPREAEQFYAEHRGKFFLNRLVSFMSSGPMCSHILCGDDAIGKWRRLMGPTKVLKTIFDEPGSIRGRYGLTDTRNCTHGSDSEETARREIKFFFPEFDIDKWYKEEHTFFQQDLVTFDDSLDGIKQFQGDGSVMCLLYPESFYIRVSDKWFPLYKLHLKKIPPEPLNHQFVGVHCA